MTSGGGVLLVASLRDIIRSEERAGRPQDLAVLPVLRKTLDEQTAQENNGAAASISGQSYPPSGNIMNVSSTARGLVLLLAIVLTNRALGAQVCIGAAPFSNGNLRVGMGGGSSKLAGLSGADGESSGGVHVALGASRGAFVTAGASVTLYTSSDIRFIREKFATGTTDDASSSTLSFSGGYSVSLSPSRRIELCPTAGFALQNGPGMYQRCTPYVPGQGIRCDGSISGQARAQWFGGSIGRINQVSPRLAFVPFVGAAFVSSRIAAGDRSQTDGYVELSLGAGVVVKRLTIRPTLAFTLGQDRGTEGVGGFDLSFNIGPKRARKE